MERSEVHGSSHIAAVGWDLKSQTLEVVFKTGAVWHYKGDFADQYNRMVKSDYSAGTILHREVLTRTKGEKISG